MADQPTLTLTLTDEQEELSATLRRFLAAKTSLQDLRAKSDSDVDFDRDVWQQAAKQIGVQALTIPEKYEGLGQGAIESMLVFEAAGRVLYDGPLLSTIAMASNALVLSEDHSACNDYLPGIADGSVTATLAVTESDGGWDIERTETVAADSEGTWILCGGKSFVLHGHTADVMLVTAKTGHDVSLFAVKGDAEGVRADRMRSLDLSRPMSTVVFSDAPARLVGRVGAAPRFIAAALDRILVAVAAEQSGAMRAVLERCVAYAKERTQFGAPIGSYQAIAHKLVDMLGAVEFSEAAVRYASSSAAAASPEFPVAARVAAAYCSRAYRAVTTEAIQIHGGTGFTWEHDLHLYYRHAWSTQQLFGDPAHQYREVANRVGL